MSFFELLGRWLRRSSGRTRPDASPLQTWVRDWHRYARLRLEQLEERLPPGTLLGMPWDVNGEVPPPEVYPEPEPTEPAVIYAAPDEPAFTYADPPIEPTIVVPEPPSTSTSIPLDAAPPTNDADLAFLAGISTAPYFTLAEPPVEPGGPPMPSGSPAEYDPPYYGASNGSMGPGTSYGTGGGYQAGPWNYYPGFVAFEGVQNLAGGQSVYLTNDNTPTLVGTGTAGLTVQLTLPDQSHVTTTVGDDGRWAATIGSPLSDGWQSINIDLLANGGTVSQTSAQFQVDTTAPTATLTVENPYLVGTNPVFHIQVQDAAMAGPVRVEFDIDHNQDGDYNDDREMNQSEVYASPFSDTSYMLPDFAEGNANVRVRMIDEAGNVGVSNSIEIFKAFGCDEQPPLDFSNDPEYWNSLAGFVPQTGEFPTASMPTGPGATASETNGAGTTSGASVAMADTVVNESEPNNSATQTNTVAVTAGQRTTINGAISTGTDQDHFQFTLSSRAGVFFDIDSRETGLSTTLNSVITILDSTGNPITNGQNDNGYDFDTGLPAAANMPSASTADSSLYLDLAAGTYIARVASVGNTTGNYQFSIRPETNYANVAPALSSNPGGVKTIYLDFDGHAANDAWGNYNATAYDFSGNAAEFSPGEQLAIRNVWRMMSEDYSPFNVNVTTVAPATFNGNVMRVVVTGSASSILGLGPSVLGVSFLNSFSSASTTDNVAWVFTPTFDPSFNGGISGRIMATSVEIGNTGSHEVGHTLGLDHYGSSASSPYTPPASVIPNALMASPDFGLNREIWGRGTNAANASQDDMAVIANATNAIGLRPDDHGNSQATATTLSLVGPTTYAGSGIINHVTNDTDWFRFSGPSVAGNVTVTVNVDEYINDLRPTVTLRDSAGTVVATATAAASGTPNFDATVTANLSNQDYFVTVGSAGQPGEAGQYDLIVTLPSPPTPPPPPPGPSGPPNGGGTFPGDVYEDNDTSAEATNRAVLGVGTQNYLQLTINRKNGLPDYDWFRWTAGLSGVATVTTTTTSGGNIELSLWRLDGNTLVELSRDARLSVANRAVQAVVTVGQTILVQVKGANTSLGVMDQAVYDFTAVIA